MEKSNKELMSDLGIDLRRVHSSGKTTCPKCSHTRKKKNDPCLSVNIFEGIYNCHNCGWAGKVFSKDVYVPAPKEYVRPKLTNTTQCSDGIVKWFLNRGISQRTVELAGISESFEYMPQTQKEEKVINFNYFREGELINTKFRGNKKIFKLVKNAELIFYGIDDIKDSDWCVIVEGEMDKLAYLEVGVKEVVSVPNGASKSSVANLEYLDNCIGYFDNKKKIIIATDNDEPGMSLRDELCRRLGAFRCYKVDFKGLKDANDYLISHGDKLRSTILDDNLSEFPISGVIMADSKWDDLEILFKNGLRRGDTTKVMKEFDKMVSFVPGHSMLITGIPNHGKSPFSLEIAVSLSINHGWKWGIFTPEHKPLELFLAKICEMVLGKRMRQGVGFMETEKQICRSFINDHFIFIEPEKGDNKLDSIIEKAQTLVIRKGIRGLIIDPWNKIESSIEKGETETLYISRMLDSIIDFNQAFHVFTMIIAHPTKIKKKANGLFEVPNLYDVAGSSNWFNKVDWGVTFYRNYETGNNEVYVQKAKWEHLGYTGNCVVKYNVNNGRFCDVYAEYDNSNWLAPAISQLSLDIPQVTNQIMIPESVDEIEESPF